MTHPPAPVSREAFVRNLARSGLSAADDLMTAVNSLPAAAVPDGDAVAAHLISAGHLTRFQADAVLADRPADLRMGNYELIDKLGAGGMGAVFKARHRRMKRVVALKVLHRDGLHSPAFAQRFQREVETIARLSHPNIVMAFDADEADAGPFLVMEFVNGRDLTSEVQTGGPLSVAEAVDWLAQAARGLEYAHGQGIVHRDIKPSNLLRDAAGTVKVADLGLARLNNTAGPHSSLTSAGGMVGTLDYMPPEQALDSTAIDHRVDIYSLGATLYFLLTARPPFTAGSIMGLLLKHREAPVPDLRAGPRPDVPGPLNDLFLRMMAKSPDGRPQTMTEVVRALDGLLAAGGLPADRPGHPAGAGAATPGSSDMTMSIATGTGLPASSKADTVVGVKSPTTGGGPLAGLTIILAEPSRTQGGIVRAYLRQGGATDVHVTAAGREARDLARQTGARVVVASMHLSDMSGLQLADAVAADPAAAKLGFVLATSEDDSGSVAVPPRVVVLRKPFTPEKLVEAVVAAVTRSGG